MLYIQADLNLLHYDSRAHLVVARRVLDSRTPGLEQFGTHWLPLPHLLNFLPAKIDFLYRTGLAAGALSLFCWWGFLLRLNQFLPELGLPPRGVRAGLAVAGLHPGLLYLASTPMTEPMFFFCLAGGAVHLLRSQPPAGRRASRLKELVKAGAWIGLGCLTRYEAWLTAAVAAALLLFITHDPQEMSGRTPLARIWQRQLRPVVAFLIGPAIAVGGFLAYSAWSTGSLFFLRGLDFHRFPLPPSFARGLVLSLIGLVLQFGWIGLVALGAGTVALLLARNRRLWMGAALLAAPALFVVTALSYGLGFRPRYLLVALPLLVLGWALIATRLRTPWRLALTSLIVLQGWVPLFPVSDAVATSSRWVSGFSSSGGEQLARELADSCPSQVLTPRPRALLFPWPDHAILLEACATNLGSAVDERVARVLRLHDDGEPILAPMADLAGWMYATRLPLSRFIHEGNWPDYEEALREPRAHAGWVALRLGSRLEESLGPRLERAPEFTQVVRAVDQSGYGVVLYWRAGGPRQARLTHSGNFPYHHPVPVDRVERYQKLLAANPENILVRFSLCQAYFDAGQYEDAIPEFRRVLEEKQDWMLVYLLLGRSLVETGRAGEARPVLEQGIELALSQHHEGPLTELRELLSSIPSA
ncbi:MAG: tetratricopeptide repeat protein [Acidobacteria bacterium]|nr:tetratricopeptide repeat protein [Acidobacteriota bacterium]